MATRTLQEIQAEQPSDATLRNLISLLEAKLALGSRYSLLEYEAGLDGREHAATAFRAVAHMEHGQIQRLLAALVATINDINAPVAGAKEPNTVTTPFLRRPRA